LKMDAGIISIGNELILGELVDTNAAFLSQELYQLGAEVRFHVTVGDDRARLAEAVEISSRNADLILMTGGLGPTRDDITRHAISDAVGKPLELHEPSLKRLRRFFARRGRTMPEANAIQAMFPKGAVVIPNDRGTAPGFRIKLGKCHLVAMPGVPPEMKYMFRKYVRSFIRKLPAPRSPIATKTLVCFGIPESTIGQAIHDLMNPEGNPTVGTQASGGVIALRIVARGDDRRNLIRRAERRIRKELGDTIFGVGGTTLQEAVAKLLEKFNMTIAVAESCTGGLIGDLLTDVPGISRFLLEDIVAYSNESKVKRLGVPAREIQRFGAVSKEVAIAMARGVKRRSGADIGLSTTGIAGPTGATPTKPVGLVHIGLAIDSDVFHRELRLSGDRITIKNRAAKYALDFLRLHLLERSA